MHHYEKIEKYKENYYSGVIDSKENIEFGFFIESTSLLPNIVI